MSNKKDCLTLTIKEGAELSRIGINRLRKIVREEGCPFALHVGTNKLLIKRKQFEEWLNTCEAV